MAMHRLPPGTESPRWRALAAVWALSAALAFLLSLAMRLTWGVDGRVTAPLLWLAIQWALWLYIKDRPARLRPILEGPPADDPPTAPLAKVAASEPDPGRRPGDHGLGRDLDRPGRHVLTEETVVSDPKPSPSPVPRAPADYPALDPDRFAPFTLAQIDTAAMRLQFARWSSLRVREMDETLAVLEWSALNRYLKERVYREAHAALQTVSLPSPDEVLTDFWNRKMEVIIDWFNPPDEDAACESICLDAIERAYRFAESQPCTCPPDDMDPNQEFEACQRCQVLGRVQDTEVAR